MKKIFNIPMLLLLFSCNLFNSQITLNWSITDTSFANVTIANMTDEYYYLPLDIKHLRPYEESCDSYGEFEDTYPFLAPMILLKMHNSTEVLQYSRPHIDIEKRDSINKLLIPQRRYEKENIVNWQKKMKIKTYEKAKINFYLINNILLLKPYEKINFQIPVDFHDLTNNQFNPYGYFFKGEYQASLEICIQNNISEYLTTSQRKRLKKHLLYSFPIISNQIYLKK